MDMITVLNTIPAVQGNDNWILVVVGLVIGALSIIVSCVASERPNLSLGSTVVCVICLFLFLIGMLTATVDAPEKYQCTINEGVDAKQFFETFEIDSQEGLIYTVYLKEDK